MNLKKIAATLGLLLFGAAASAEINLKDVGGGKVEITFLFKDSSSEMGVIGSFDNWTVPGEVMTKNADGVWEKTLSALATDEIVYKFYSKGTYIFDEQAPDKKDDGYGGFNGLIVVADILSGVTPMKPGAAPLAAPKAKAVGGRQKSTFGTETYLESASTFGTGSSELTKSVINAKSLWKFDGDLVPNLPGHLELTMFSAQSTVMEKNGQSWARGGELVAGGLLMQPFYYLGGNKKPEIDKFRFGIDAPYLEWETGYANSTLPAHEGVLWETVSAENKANAGFSSFRLGPKVRTLGDLTIDAAIVPNKSQNDFYGMYSWIKVDAGVAAVEVQYDLKASTKTDAGKAFEKPSRQDWIVGAEGYWDDFFVKGQFLSTAFGPGVELTFEEQTSLKAVLGYRDVYESQELAVGFAYRGGLYNKSGKTMDPSSQLLYGNSDDELGSSGTQSVSVDGFQTFGYWGKATFEGSYEMPVAANPRGYSTLKVRPGFWVNFETLEIQPFKAEVFSRLRYNTAGQDAFRLTEVGGQLAFHGLDVFYQFDNNSETVQQHSVLAEAPVGDIRVQGGVGYRQGSAANQTMGVVLGAAYELPVPEARTPTVYTQFVWNMDPYNAADNPAASRYDLTDFGPTNGASAFDGQGALRLGIRWNY